MFGSRQLQYFFGKSSDLTGTQTLYCTQKFRPEIGAHNLIEFYCTSIFDIAPITRSLNLYCIPGTKIYNKQRPISKDPPTKTLNKTQLVFQKKYNLV